MRRSESDVDNLTDWLSFLEARASNYNSIASTTLTIAVAIILSIAASFTLIKDEWIKYPLVGVLTLSLLILYILVISTVGIPWIKALQAKEIADKIIRGELKTSEEVREKCKEKLL